VTSEAHRRLRTVLGRRDLRVLFSAALISLTEIWAHSVALAAFVFDLRPGDCLGEIGGLEGIARTATVTTTAAYTLFRLDGADFLDALTTVPSAATLLDARRARLATTRRRCRHVSPHRRQRPPTRAGTHRRAHLRRVRALHRRRRASAPRKDRR
jgi:CRP-like cAMP-binding protein